MKWFDIRDYETDFRPINIIIGGRGIGKTYSALDFVYKSGKKFLYLRNTVTQLDECCCDFGNPFKKLNTDKGYNVHMEKSKNHAFVYDGDDIIGYAAALSTFENLRGVDLSDVEIVIFDEFIQSGKLTFDQFRSFINFYETVNRNRELLGESPLICFLLSNSQSLNNEILMGYNLIPVIEHMDIVGQRKYKNEAIMILRPKSEISELKKQSGHAKLIKGSKVYKETLENEFAYDSFYGIVKRKLTEYNPVCQIDDVYIYKHKSRNIYYACATQATNIKEFSSRDNAMIFFRTYGKELALAAADGKLEYSDFVIKSKLSKILNF